LFFVLTALAAFVSAAPADSEDVMNLKSVTADMDVAESHHKKVYKPKVKHVVPKVKYVVPKVKYVKAPVYKVVYKKHHG